MINHRLIISLGLVLLLMCSSFTATALLPKSIDDDEWADGAFNGTITLSGLAGTLTGTTNLGRSSTKGVFQATIDINDTTYAAKGWFRENILLGTMSSGVLRLPLIGRINLERSSFHADLIFPQGSLEAIYTASYLPPVSGEYGIGVADYHLIDGSRDEVLTEDPDDLREFIIKVWYPTELGIEGEWYEYMPEVMFSWLMGRSPISLPGVSDVAYEDVMPHAKIEVPISLDEEMFPVVLFAHGLDGTLEIYTSFIEELVTQGYVVISMNHPYIAGVVEFPDGRTIYCSDFFSQTDPEYAEKALRTIIEDAKYALDYAELLNSTSELFDGHLDFEHVGMYGHSFGGASTSVCCAEDTRIDCGLTLDGVCYEEMIPEGATKPFFMMTADGRFNSSGVEYIWGKEETDIYKMSILGSSHYGYTDVGLLLSHMLPIIPQNLLGFGTVDAKVMTQITRLFVVEFFDAYLKGESVQSILDISEEFAASIEFDYR